MKRSAPAVDQRVVELSTEHLIGRGSRRLCYEFPGRLDLCIKIPREKKNAHLQQRREIRYYASLRKRGVPTDRLAWYRGSVPTSLGRGYVYDAVRDADGRISRQLIHYMRERPDDYRQYLRVLRLLEDYLFDHLVLIYDLNPHNVLCRRAADGRLEPVIIDGVGDVVAIPMLNLSRTLVLRKIRRRWKRMIDKMIRNHAWMAKYRMRH